MTDNDKKPTLPPQQNLDSRNKRHSSRNLGNLLRITMSDSDNNKTATATNPPPELLRAILTRLAEKLSDAELARMMDTNPRYIARWRAGINVPRHLERTVYLCLGISLDHGLIPTPDATNTDE